MRLGESARVAVIGAGPGGLATAKHALEVGLQVTVFEASDDIGGQWHTTAPHSGVWPGMRTNTSRMMTAFSDFPPPQDHELYPLAEQIHGYLRNYAQAFGVTEHISFGTPVTSIEPGWLVNGEPYDGVVVASGRFHTPRLPDGIQAFRGELLHAFDYPGAEAFRGKRVVVYGNGISGHEIASDLAEVTQVVSAFRKPRYVIQKVVAGVPSDWRWYTHVGALQRQRLAPEDFGRLLRQRVVQLSGHPADFGAPAPHDDILVAGLSLCQDYLAQVRDGRIVCRPAIAAVQDRTVTFVDGSQVVADVLVCATGYDVDLPFLPAGVRSALGPDLRLHQRTWHPDLPGLALVGQFALQGPYFPLLELQARWITGVWAGEVAPPDVGDMRESVTEAPPAIDVHNVLALAFAKSAGVAPHAQAHPELTEALLFGPMLPPRYRLDGFGAQPAAERRFIAQLASSALPPVHAEDVAMLPSLDLSL